MKYKTIVLLSTLLVVGLQFSVAQNYKGKMFPYLNGETFSGSTVKIPFDTKGKSTLLGVCFSKDAEKDLKTWMNPVYNLFLEKKDENDPYSASANYDVHFYFVPMLNKVNQILEKSSKEKIKKETDKEFWPHLVFFEGDTKPFRETFELKDLDIPYFFVLDKEGNVVRMASGKYSESKMDSLEDAIEPE